MQPVTLNASRDTLRELTKLDNEVRLGVMPFFECFELTIGLVDCNARTITSIIRLEETVPMVICRGPIWFHPSVVSVSATRVNTWERTCTTTRKQGGFISEQVLPDSVGGRGSRDLGWNACRK